MRWGHGFYHRNVYDRRNRNRCDTVILSKRASFFFFFHLPEKSRFIPHFMTAYKLETLVLLAETGNFTNHINLQGCSWILITICFIYTQMEHLGNIYFVYFYELTFNFVFWKVNKQQVKIIFCIRELLNSPKISHKNFLYCVWWVLDKNIQEKNCIAIQSVKIMSKKLSVIYKTVIDAPQIVNACNTCHKKWPFNIHLVCLAG